MFIIGVKLVKWRTGAAKAQISCDSDTAVIAAAAVNKLPVRGNIEKHLRPAGEAGASVSSLARISAACAWLPSCNRMQ